MTGVAVGNEGEGGNAPTETTVEFGLAVFDLSVAAVDGDGNSAVAVGNNIFYVDADTPKLSKKATGYFFGVALEVIASGETATIKVLHVPSPGAGTVGNGTVGTAQLADGAGTMAKLDEQIVKYVDVTITSAQLLALNATPKQIVAAPGSGKAVVPIGAILYKPSGTAYAGIATGEDISFKYTNGSGAEVMQAEATGFLDQATAQTRYAFPVSTNITPVANAAIVAHMLVGEIITGDSDLLIRFYYRVIPTTLS
jgi:hypothetical protein